MRNARIFGHALALISLASLCHCGGSEPPPAVAAPSPSTPHAPVATATPPDKPTPPATPRKDVTDTYQGVAVVDPYRWLESGTDPAVHTWSDAQNQYARTFLDAMPERPALKSRIAELLNSQSPDFFALLERKGTLFALEDHPPKQQPYLVVLKTADVTTGKDDAAPAERVLVDPNALEPSGALTIDFYVPSPDGKKVAVSMSRNGSESGDVHVFDVATGKAGDVVPRVNGGTAGGSVAWNADGSGLYYTRYPREGERPPADMSFYQQVWFHKLGAPASADTYAIGKDAPRIAEFKLDTTDDGRYVLATASNGDGGEFEHWLLGPSGKWQKLTEFADKVVGAELGRDGFLYLLSRKDAPKGKVLRTPLAKPALASATVLVPEGDAVIQDIEPAKTRLYVVDLVGGPSQIRAFSIDARGAKPAAPATIGILPTSTVNQVVRLSGDDLLVRNQSYLEPPAWYRYDASKGTFARTALRMTSKADFSDSEVVREECTSKDGTKVPLSIVRKKGVKLDGSHPTILYGYGGFGVSQQPKFRPVTRVWIESGGVYAVANLRGGGELGQAWYDAGKLTHKQNVFDDFAACAKTLLDLGYTRPEHLGILGGSNGGLLMGAELTQHPELFHAVVSRVGIYDMLRNETTSNGSFNTTEYGSVKDPAEFQALYGYSPYHHVKDGTAYPAVLMMTGAHDPRVEPWQSRKMVARLQAATGGKGPILLRTSGDTGHGLSTPLSEEIDEDADYYGFFFHELGVKPGQ